MIRLVVYETYPLFHVGIKAAFKDCNFIYVAGDSSEVKALFPLLAVTPAEVVLLGVNQNDNHLCVDVARRIHHDYPQMKILAFTDEDTEQTIRLLMDVGINGFIGKRQADGNERRIAIQQVVAGEKYIGRIDKNTHFYKQTRYSETQNKLATNNTLYLKVT